MDSPWQQLPWRSVSSDQGAQLNLGTENHWDMKVNGVGEWHPMHEMENKTYFYYELYYIINLIYHIMLSHLLCSKPPTRWCWIVCPFTWAWNSLSLSSPVPRSPSHQWAKSHWAAKPMYRTGYRIACPCHHTRSRRVERELLGTPIWGRKADRLQDLKSSVPNGVKNLTIPIRSNNIRYV